MALIGYFLNNKLLTKWFKNYFLQGDEPTLSIPRLLWWAWYLVSITIFSSYQEKIRYNWMFVCHCLWSKLYWQNSSAGTSLVRRESFLLSFAFSLWTKMSATREGTQSESFEGWKKSCDKDFLDTCPQPEEGLHMSLWRMNTILKHHKINKDQIQRRDSIRVF